MESSKVLEYYGKNSLIVFSLHGPILWIIHDLIKVISIIQGVDIPQENFGFSILKLFLVLILVLPFILVVHCYLIGVLKHLNVRRSLSFHFESVIPASLAGVFSHSTPLSSLYLNPPCSLQKLKWVQ